MTENEYQEMPMPPYDHGAVMEMRRLTVELCGTEHDPVYLICAYLQQAVEPKLFNQIIKLLQIPNDELIHYLNNGLLPDEEQK